MRTSGRYGAAAATVVQAAAIAAGGLTSLVIARELGADGTGVYAAAGQLLLAAMMLGGLGLRTGLAHEIAAGRLTAHAAATQATLTSVLLGAVAGVATFGAYEAGSETLFEGISEPVAIVISAAIPFAVAWWVLAAIPLAREDYDAYAIQQSSPFVLSGVLVVALVFAFELDGALIGFAASFVIVGIAAVIWARRETTERVGEGWHLAESLRLGLRGWMLEMLQLPILRPDILIVAAYCSSADVGVYSMAITITTVAFVLPQALGTVALPRVASSIAVAETEPHEPITQALVRRSLRYGALLALAGGVIVAIGLLLAPVIFGDDFGRTVGLGMIMLAGVIALAFGRVVIALLLGMGRGNDVLLIGAAVVPAALAAYLLAVPDGGPTAAAIVSGAAYVATTVGALIAFRRSGALTPPG